MPFDQSIFDEGNRLISEGRKNPEVQRELDRQAKGGEEREKEESYRGEPLNIPAPNQPDPAPPAPPPVSAWDQADATRESAWNRASADREKARVDPGTAFDTQSQAVENAFRDGKPIPGSRSLSGQDAKDAYGPGFGDGSESGSGRPRVDDGHGEGRGGIGHRRRDGRDGGPTAASSPQAGAVIGAGGAGTPHNTGLGFTAGATERGEGGASSPYAAPSTAPQHESQKQSLGITGGAQIRSSPSEGSSPGQIFGAAVIGAAKTAGGPEPVKRRGIPVGSKGYTGGASGGGGGGAGGGAASISAQTDSGTPPTELMESLWGISIGGTAVLSVGDMMTSPLRITGRRDVQKDGFVGGVAGQTRSRGNYQFSISFTVFYLENFVQTAAYQQIAKLASASYNGDVEITIAGKLGNATFAAGAALGIPVRLTDRLVSIAFSIIAGSLTNTLA